MDWLTEPFEAAFMQRALVEVLVLGLACGPLGAWVLLYRQSYAAESMAHGMLPGLVLAALAGAPLVLGAAGGVLVAAVAIALAGRDERLGGDTGVAVAVSGLLGLGALLALRPEAPPRLQELLFGDLLGVTSTDVTAAAVLAAGVLVVLALAHRPLSVSAFDATAARSLGTAPARWQLALLVLLALATVAAAPGLGSLLLVALLLAPGIAGLRLASRMPTVLAVAAGTGALAGVAGLMLSFHLGIAAGAAVALAATAIASLALLR